MQKCSALFVLVFFISQLALSQVSVYFPFAKHNLRQEQESILANISIPVTNTTVRIKAFTDSVGTVNNNIVLAQKRANTIKEYLLRRGNYDIIIQAVGETTDAINDSLNRRVEISWIVNDPIEKEAIATREVPNVIERYTFTKIFFISNTPIVKKESYKDLDSLYKSVLLAKNKKLEIRGHINWPYYYGKLENDSIMRGLSLNRAKTIYTYLKNKGVPMQNISCRGMDNTEMLHPDPQSPIQLQQNMRVEIVVVDDKINNL